jgi:hypothetical protein
MTLIIISSNVFLHHLQVAMEDFFESLSAKISLYSAPAHNSDCRIWAGNVTSNRLYGLLSYRDPETNIWKKKHVHRLALMVQLRSLNIPKELDASHLCHNSLCVNVNHLSLEPHSVNNNRQCCKGCGHCIGHGDFPDCMLKLKL